VPDARIEAVRHWSVWEQRHVIIRTIDSVSFVNYEERIEERANCSGERLRSIFGGSEAKFRESAAPAHRELHCKLTSTPLRYCFIDSRVMAAYKLVVIRHGESTWCVVARLQC